MKKRLLSLFLCLCIMLPFAGPCFVQAAAENGYVLAELYYDLDGTYTVTEAGDLFSVGIGLDAIDLTKFGYGTPDQTKAAVEIAAGKLGVQFDLFIDGDDALVNEINSKIHGQVELTSGGTNDNQELTGESNILKWKNGQWNRCVADLTMFSKRQDKNSLKYDFNPANINYFRMYINAFSSEFVGKSATVKVTAVRIVDLTKEAPSEEEDPLGVFKKKPLVYTSYEVLEKLPLKITGNRTVTDTGGFLERDNNIACSLDLTQYGYPEKDVTKATGIGLGKLALQFDLYLSGDSKLVDGITKGNISGQIELCSGGSWDSQELTGQTTQLKFFEGQWNRCQIDLGNFQKRMDKVTGEYDFDPSAINFMRIYMITNSGNFVGLSATMKICNICVVDLTEKIPNDEAGMLGDGSFDADPPTYEVVDAPEGFYDDDVVVSGYNLVTYMQEHNMKDIVDYTPVLQSLCDAMSMAGGGTVYVPAGHYRFDGDLILPTGVTICGDWQNPDEHPAIDGTVFEVYGNRDNVDGAPFIKMKSTSMISNVAFWYPEQSLTDLVPYPRTVSMGEHTHLKNVTFVNSYIGVTHDPRIERSPNLMNIYGTPLLTGVDMDAIGDIARWENINFSPEYWINSGLPGAPVSDEEAEDLRVYIYNSATGFIVRRIDWSYLYRAKFTGYATGMLFAYSNLPDGAASPNGQCYDVTFDHCNTGIYVETIGDSGEMVTDAKFIGCQSGLWLGKGEHPYGTFELIDSTIDATGAAISAQQAAYFYMLSNTIENGAVEVSNGWLIAADNVFKGEAPVFALKNGTLGAVLQHNCTADGKPMAVDNKAFCPSADDPAELGLPEIPKLTPEQAAYRSYKPENDAVYISGTTEGFAALDSTGETDVTAALQAQIDLAASKGGGTLFLPAGHYRLDSADSITIPTGVQLLGACDYYRLPYQCGTIFQLYAGAGEPEGTPAFIMKAKSGMRGIVFDWPEQYSEGEWIEYPYAIRGEGEDIYIVNVSLRNGWNGVDLMSVRCDRHYVDSLFGNCLKNMLRIGGGSTDGLVRNCHSSGAALQSGETEGYGFWTKLPEDFDTFRMSYYNLVQNQMVVVQLGDVENEVLLNGFNYNGEIGVQFVAEETGAANALLVGQGVDHVRVSLDFLATEKVEFINTELTAFNIIGEDVEKEINYIHFGEDMDSEVNFYGILNWANPDVCYNIENGTLNMYGLLHKASPYTAGSYSYATDFSRTGENGRINVLASQISYYSRAVVNFPAATETNPENVNFNGALFWVPIEKSDEYGTFDNIVYRVMAWDAPSNATMPANSTVLFTNAFTSYDVKDTKAQFQPIGSEVQASRGVVNLTVGGDSISAGINATDLGIASGREDSLYRLESRINVKELREGDYSRMVFMLTDDAKHTVTVAAFTQTGDVLVMKNGSEVKIGSFDKNVWYRLAVELDLRDPAAPTYTVYLLDDEYGEVASSEKLAFDSKFAGLGAIDALLITVMADMVESEEPVTASAATIDYVFVTYSTESSFGTPGDVNGDGKIDSTDARLILQYYAKKIGEGDLNTGMADVNGDGKVDSTDARLILQLYAKKITEFPKA